MSRTNYTCGFEKVWKTWRGVTSKESDKPEAFRYWKRDKLEGDEDELIRILLLQADERKRIKALRIWQPEWCFCRKWLSRHRYEYIPESKKEDTAAEQRGLERKRQEIREMYGDYLQERTIEELQELRKDKKEITRWWLIDKIIKTKVK